MALYVNVRPYAISPHPDGTVPPYGLVELSPEQADEWVVSGALRAVDPPGQPKPATPPTVPAAAAAAETKEQP